MLSNTRKLSAKRPGPRTDPFPQGRLAHHPRPTVVVAPRRRKRRPLALLAIALLLLFLGVLLRQMVGAGVEALRGATYNRPAVVRGTPPAPYPDAGLQASIQTAAVLPNGHVEVAVRDLARGATANLDADAPVPAASLFKLPILVETLKQIRLNNLTPDQSLEITQKAWTDGSGVLQARVGDHVAVSELLRLMIQQSDNIAALVLLDQVGWQATNDDMAALGLSSTVLHDHRTGDNAVDTTSAADMATLMQTIATGHLIDAATSESALQLLELKQDNNWLGTGLPWWVKVAHKWGQLPDASNDAGIIFTPDGEDVMVVLAQNGSPDAQSQAITRVAQAAFNHLANP